MKHHTPFLPGSLFGQAYDLPVAEQAIHTASPETMMPHRLFDWSDQAPGRKAQFFPHADEWQPFYGEATDGNEPRRIRQRTRTLAAASFLEGARRRQKGITAPDPEQGVGIVPVFPAAQECLLTRKDFLYPHPFYCERLAFLGGGIDAHELELWKRPGDHATVAMCREAYEEILFPEIADEVTAQMGYFGALPTTCYLWNADGSPASGRLHLFLSVASSEAQWTHWCDHLLKQGGVGEGTPLLLCTRTTLLQAFEQEREATRNRLADLKAHSPTGTGAFNASASARERPPFDASWRQRREQEHQAGRFPINDRGTFPFIAGHGLLLEEALRAHRFIR